MRALLAIFITLPLLACTTTDQSRTAAAFATPLSDLNLVRNPIPEVLERAQQAPYGLLKDSSCEGLAQEIGALDAALGPDIDAPASETERGLLERGADEVSGAAVGAVRRTAEGIIPFRGWIRKLSGAERQSRKVAAAITAGGVRRAFLKGMRAAQNCPA
ncbi:MAG: hypothetical protein RJA44_69 [Pseudomonadota bacterium]|jgi:hypothetical protein